MVPQGKVTFHIRSVAIGDASPQSRLFLSVLAPHCPANLAVLPETVRSGADS